MLSFSRPKFLGVCPKWGAFKSIFFVVNVYSKTFLIDTRSIWIDLCLCKLTLGGEVWCVLYDFNSISLPCEIRGSGGSVTSFSNAECDGFFIFISRMNLLDLPLWVVILLGSNLIEDALVDFIGC